MASTGYWRSPLILVMTRISLPEQPLDGRAHLRQIINPEGAAAVERLRFMTQPCTLIYFGGQDSYC